MDTNNLKGLMEAYQQVNAPQQIDEVSRRDEFTRAAIARNSGRKGGITFEPGPNWDPSANRGRGAHLNPKQKEKQRRKALRQEDFDIFDVVLEFLQAEGYAETLEEAEWMMANMIDEEAIDIILGEEQLDEVSLKTKMSAFKKRATDEFESDGDNPRNYTKSGASKADKTKENIVKKHGEKAGQHAERAAHTGIFGRKSFSMPKKPTNEEFVDEAQEARNNPEKYEADQKKKSAPVRGERTPMPPRGDKRREDFEKWYAKQMGR